MRSNFLRFIVAMAVFTVIYVILVFTKIEYLPNSNTVSCLDGIDPAAVSGCVSFAFFLFFTKCYSYDEAYFYGQSRKGAFCSALCGAAVYAVMFAFYALGTALLVRRSVLSSADIGLSADVYRISAAEIFYNFAYLVIVDLIAFELANILRKFRSWKFWIAITVCIAAFILLYIFNVVLPQSSGIISDFDYWGAMFAVFVPQLIVMAAGDFFMTRGRMCR